jgi:hypothetical protein
VEPDRLRQFAVCCAALELPAANVFIFFMDFSGCSVRHFQQ